MKLWNWIQEHSLWFVSAGLMLASSGLDGVYMGQLMPIGFLWLGLVLNTMSDIGNLVLMYWYGRLRQEPIRSKRYKRSWLLLPAEVVAISYSWFFSWRQLRAVLPAVEAIDWQWVAPISAGFIPLLLAFIGYAQSLLAGKLEEEPDKAEGKPAERRQKLEVLPVLAYQCEHCPQSFATQQALNAHCRIHRRSNGRGAYEKENQDLETTSLSGIS